MSTIKISYPSGISPDIASKLSAAANGADTVTGPLNSGVGTLDTVMSDVSVVVNQIMSSSRGQGTTALAGFWDGGGSIGRGGLGTGGVISDGSKAQNFLTSASGCMPGVSGSINDNLAAVSSGISAIATVQANPNKNWTQSEAHSLELQIGNLVSALQSINTALLSTASAIEQSAGELKLKGSCASGVTIGDFHGPILTSPPAPGSPTPKKPNPTPVTPPTPPPTPVPPTQPQPKPKVTPPTQAQPKPKVTPTPTPTPTPGGGGKPPQKPPQKPPTGGPGGHGVPEPFRKLVRQLIQYFRRNARVAAFVGTFNSAPYAVSDLIHGKDPFTDNKFWAIYSANLAQGFLAAPVLRGSESVLLKLGLPATKENLAIVQSMLGSGAIGDGVVLTPWLIGKIDHLLQSHPHSGVAPRTPTGVSPSPSLPPPPLIRGH